MSMVRARSDGLRSLHAGLRTSLPGSALAVNVATSSIVERQKLKADSDAQADTASDM